MGAGETFIDRFVSVAERHPKATAILDAGRPLSYSELLDRARIIAGRLVDKGVGPEDIVALHLEKSVSFIAGLLGTWLAGGAFLPLDPSLPLVRRRFVCKDSAPRLALGLQRHATELNELGLPWIALDSPEPEKVESGPISSRATMDGLAYLIYTSGSTGRPKGVLVPHHGLLNVLDDQIAVAGLGPGKRSLFLLSTSFDAAVSDIGTALLSGAALCLEPVKNTASISRLLETIRNRGITFVDIPPSLLAAIPTDRAPECLEALIIGGEQCPPEAVRSWGQRVKVINVYGPTEATICTSLIVCNPETWTHPLIGDPVTGIRYAIRDDQGRDCQVGEPGELCIFGKGLARGYLNMPELTALKFPGNGPDRHYRTGDRVVQHADGGIEFLGRLDRQFKLRGQLVEPEEIEARLRAHPAVRRSAVLKRSFAANGSPARQVLAAFVELDDGAVATQDELAAHVAAELPAWMVPRHFVIRGRLPETVTGKIDLAALARAKLDRDHRGADGITPTERVLLQIYRHLFETDAVSVDDSFCSLRGDSLIALQLILELENEEIGLGADEILSRRSIRELAREIEVGDGSRSDVRSSAELAKMADSYRASIPATVAAAIRGSAHTYTLDAILVTGAAGFLGSHLVDELIRHSEATIICLIRAADTAAATSRLLGAFRRYGLHASLELQHRLKVLAGDAAAPRFGLDTASWEFLSRNTDAICHCAATVNMLLPYDALRRDNVEATLEVARLAMHGRPKRLHYASTLSVFVASDHNKGTLRENDEPATDGFVYGGYGQSKWVAERILRQLPDPECPVTIYRFGLITGHSRTGTGFGTDQLSLFTRGLVELGCIPEVALDRLFVDMTPVDYAAAAMARLLVRPASFVAKTFHIANPASTPLRSWIGALRRAGCRIVSVDDDAWRDAAARLANNPAAATAVLSLCRIDDELYRRHRSLDLFQATDVRFDMRNTEAALGKSGLSCPAPDDLLLQRYATAILGLTTDRDGTG